MKTITFAGQPIAERSTVCENRRGVFRWHLVNRLQRLTDKLYRWYTLARERRQLQGLSDHILKDIGLSRADIEQEARRPFWDDRDVGG